jgi:cell division septum initiation protein DivIVA
MIQGDPMTITDDPAHDPSFRTRPIGFDRREVLAFVNNLLSDYGRVKRDLERAQQELLVAQGGAAERRVPSVNAARDVERILAGAQRIATEIEDAAKEERSRVLAEANARAGEILDEARQQAGRIVEDGRRRAAQLALHIESMRAHYVQLRPAFEVAAEYAANALSEIDALERQVEFPVAETTGV